MSWHDERRALALEEVRYHRRVLELHANDPETGACPICHVARCLDWRNSFDSLAVAGEVMADLGRWEQLPDHPRPGVSGCGTFWSATERI